MTLPHFVPRDYSGGVIEGVQLTAAIGSTDLSFTIATTTGWVNANGDPLGTVGPFTVVIDQGTPFVEKISCQSVNLSSGLVTVVAGGRGYDQTTAQAHVPGASAVGVVPCWSAVEAAEANAAVVFGPGGGSAISGLMGNPEGRIHAITVSITTSLAPCLNTVASDYLVGGFTHSAHGLIVPITGSYQFNVCVAGAVTGADAQVGLVLRKNTSTTVSSGTVGWVLSGKDFCLQLSDVLQCTAGDTLDPFAQIGTGTAVGVNVNNVAYNYMTASLISS